jgi:hypothetical protein
VNQIVAMPEEVLSNASFHGAKAAPAKVYTNRKPGRKPVLGLFRCHGPTSQELVNASVLAPLQRLKQKKRFGGGYGMRRRW